MANTERSGNQEKDLIPFIRKVVLRTEGVHSLVPGLNAGLLGKTHKGIRITDTEKGIHADVFVKVCYGVKIPEVAWNLQERIKRGVEARYHIPVSASDIHVLGVADKKLTEEK